MIIPPCCHTCMTMPSSEERLHIMMSRSEYQTHPYCQFPRNMRALWGSHFLFGFFNSDLHALHSWSIYGKKCHKRSNVHRAKTIMRCLRPSCMLPIETVAHYQTHCCVIFLGCVLYDPYRGTNTNDKDHLVRQLTILCYGHHGFNGQGIECFYCSDAFHISIGWMCFVFR